MSFVLNEAAFLTFPGSKHHREAMAPDKVNSDVPLGKAGRWWGSMHGLSKPLKMLPHLPPRFQTNSIDEEVGDKTSPLSLFSSQ